MRFFRIFPVLAILFAAIVGWPQEQLPEFGFPVAHANQQALKIQSIRGIVVDENGAVIPKADVVLRKRKGDRTVELSHNHTDTVGRFQFNAPIGRYEVVVRRLGFKEEIARVWVSKEGAPGFKIVMTVQSMTLENRNRHHDSQRLTTTTDD